MLRKKLIILDRALWKTVKVQAKIQGRKPNLLIEEAVEQYLSAMRVGSEARKRQEVVSHAFSHVEEFEDVVEYEDNEFKTMGHQNSHPCTHLRRVAPDWLSVDECEGTCGHNSQKGKTCYWNPATCSTCPLFEHKRKDLFT